MRILGFGQSIKYHYRYTLTKIPQSNELYDVIRWVDEDRDYDLSMYNENYSRDNLKKYELQEVINAIKKTCKNKTLKDFIFLQNIVNGLSLVLFTIAVGFGPLITSKIHFEEYKPLIVALMNLVYVLITLLFHIGLVNLNERTFRNNLEKREEVSNKIVDRFNQERFNKRRVMLNMGQYGTYIEIHFYLKELQNRDKNISFANDETSEFNNRRRKTKGWLEDEITDEIHDPLNETFLKQSLMRSKGGSLVMSDRKEIILT